MAEQHGLLPPITSALTQIYAEKCTTKAAAFKLTFKFLNTAPEKVLFIMLTTKGEKRRMRREGGKKKVEGTSLTKSSFQHNPPHTLSLSTGVCSI